MSTTKPKDPSRQKPLRLWPGIALACILLFLRYLLPLFAPEALSFGILSGVAVGLLIMVWWAFFSRAPGIDRWIAVLLMIAGLYATSLFIDESIATGGQGMMFTLYSVPVLSLAFVIWAVITQSLTLRVRRVSMIAVILLASGFWVLLRNDGITGQFDPDLVWRWSRTPEERLLAREADKPVEFSKVRVVVDTVAEWPGFRGPDRDGIVKGSRIATDWSSSPPTELWRRQVGPGCSSFAVSGDFFYTQEQLGEEELVSCYVLKTGEPVWRHQDTARFWDSHAGAGPRGTPALSRGVVFTLGATGILNALDARDGHVLWSRNAAADAGTEHSGWGYCCSPLIAGEMVVVAIAGKLAAYDRDSGDLRWLGPDGGDSYSSPHLATIDGIEQVLMLSGGRIISVAPENGKKLWEYKCAGATHIVQPAFTKNGEILLSEGDEEGISRLAVTRDPDGWKFQKRWTSGQIRPNFNDFVTGKGYAYGFAGPMLACLDTEDGSGKWKSGRYGGQVILLEEQDLLLVLTERGNVALVKASPDEFRELASIKAIDGKTWNHPVLVGDVLLVRNTQEMAAFRLPVEGS